MPDSGYSFLDQLLHRLALQFNSIAEFSYELDQKMVLTKPDKMVSERHVFISGLARAGTTALMRRFYSTDLYRSLTYRDMPFVLAPNIWRRLSFNTKKNSAYTERAHGDNVLVNADSPESLEEVFWRVFTGNEYLKKRYLIPHQPAQEDIDKYILYINAILFAQSQPRERYLCKNNNNILRLGTIHKAFPEALILVPFRNPIQHALSLMRQHNNFSELQEKSSFTLSYMNWLGHYEFGLGHRPFQFSNIIESPYPIETLDYWLKLWCDTYTYLETSIPEAAVLVCYEELCKNEESWARLAKLADIKSHHMTGIPFKLSKQPTDVNATHSLADYASELYERLAKRSRDNLG